MSNTTRKKLGDEVFYGKADSIINQMLLDEQRLISEYHTLFWKYKKLGVNLIEDGYCFCFRNLIEHRRKKKNTPFLLIGYLIIKRYILNKKFCFFVVKTKTNTFFFKFALHQF